MKRRSLTGVLATGAAGLLILPVLAAHSTASAARLEVSAAPIQTWKIGDGLPELPGPPVDLSDCGDLSQFDEVVYGTEEDDDLTSGNGRQILVALGGDDLLRGGNHDDCLLGGDGDDRLFGDNGRDILVGGSGADELDGGTGTDRLDAGGDAGDVCTSVGGPDELVGCGPVGLTAEAQPTESQPGSSDPVEGGGADTGKGPGDAADAPVETGPPPGSPAEEGGEDPGSADDSPAAEVATGETEPPVQPAAETLADGTPTA